ncbi:MAG TPA: phenylalanine--tRNA ligase beta subunit-related protein [Mycobacterium sp.]
MSHHPDPSLPPMLAGAAVDDAVLALRPDYRALLIVATGVRGGPSDEIGDAALRRAEDTARARLAGRPPETLPQIAAWREAFAGFGVKPRQARSSVEALLRRVDAGLPRIDRLTDLYNALSVEQLIPVGGEDLDQYVGPPRLVRATGDEPYDTIADGDPTTITADPGEVAWRDDAGVTCRRWNWRQCVRTRLAQDTVNVLFILDGLDPVSTDALQAAGQDLVDRLRAHAPDAAVSSRLLGTAR